MEENKIIAAVLAAGIVVARSAHLGQSPFERMLNSPSGAVDIYKNCLAELTKQTETGSPKE